jgi:hypothetical protein
LDGLGIFSVEDLYDNDHYLIYNSTQSWKTKGEGGLELELQNALAECGKTKQFAMAVLDWEEGEPDDLTLTTTQVDVNHSCKPVDRVTKVCNVNFMGWLGINEIISQVSDGQIQLSVAKMNEQYYLLNADEYERQYTMCHEIDHGFGLPHTDEKALQMWISPRKLYGLHQHSQEQLASPCVQLHARNEELPGGRYFALLVTYLLVTRPFHNLPIGKRAHNLLQHVRAGNICTSRWVFSRFFSVHMPYW